MERVPVPPLRGDEFHSMTVLPYLFNYHYEDEDSFPPNAQYETERELRGKVAKEDGGLVLTSSAPIQEVLSSILEAGELANVFPFPCGQGPSSSHGLRQISGPLSHFNPLTVCKYLNAKVYFPLGISSRYFTSILR